MIITVEATKADSKGARRTRSILTVVMINYAETDKSMAENRIAKGGSPNGRTLVQQYINTPFESMHDNA